MAVCTGLGRAGSRAVRISDLVSSIGANHIVFGALAPSPLIPGIAAVAAAVPPGLCRAKTGLYSLTAV